MTAYYNEHDPFAAAWLRNLAAGGRVSNGVVDERDIQELRADDLRSHHAVHLFAGIGGWPHALRLAGWPEDAPVWTGSCPCQPFSAAGKQEAQKDARHLWPEMCRLVRECRPGVVFGEQVPGAIGHGWLDGVFADLEAEGYACGAVVLPACGVGAPHIRARLFWVAERLADAGRDGLEGGRKPAGTGPRGATEGRGGQRLALDSGPRRLADTDGRESGDGELQSGRQHGQQSSRGESGGVGDPVGKRRRPGVGEQKRLQVGDDGGVGDAEVHGRGQERPVAGGGTQGSPEEGRQQRPWDDFDVVPCRDGKARRVEPGVFPLAHGVPGRVGLLRGYGNAIVPQAAAVFVRAYLEARRP